MNECKKRAWAEIHMDRLAHNYNAIKSKLAPGCGVIGLVKANGYGHGAVAVARKLAQLGADYLAVACLDEAVELREAGICVPILILGYTPVEYTETLLHHDLTQTIYDEEMGRAYAARAAKLGRRLKGHLKVDTGMSRLGFVCDEASMDASVEQIAALCKLEGLEPEGIFMHFADADTCQAYSQMQIARFDAVVDRLSRRGITFRLRHCAASAATLKYPSVQFDLVRPGILLYGHHPDPSTEPLLDLQPVMEVRARVASVKRLGRGTCISYGRTYTLERDSLIAAVPLGYADGLLRCLSGRQEMLLHGRRAPQIGRICMDMCMLDVTDVPGVKVGDVVTLFGTDGDAYLSLEEKAEQAGTIPYELLCAVSPRLPRIYLD